MPSIILKSMKTVWVTDKPWSPPDGKITIWTIKLEDPAGDRGDYSTMSGKIATLGWSGDIELYTNDKGKEYVRQAPKEEFKQVDKPTDEYWADKQAQIRAQWAINQSREYMQHMLGSDAKLSEIFDTAKLFYTMVDQVKNGEVVTDAKQEIDPNDIPFNDDPRYQ